MLLTLMLACAGAPGTHREARGKALSLRDLPVWSLTGCKELQSLSVAPIDVVISIDASRSTGDPCGYDVNLNGTVGKAVVFHQRDKIVFGTTDPADSFLAAQVAASRVVMRDLNAPGVRFAIVAYSARGFQLLPGQPFDVIVESPLTQDSAVLESALAEVLKEGSRGGTEFTLGLTASRRVLDTPGSGGLAQQRVILLISDSPWPLEHGKYRKNDPALDALAREIGTAGIVIHSFGMGKDTVSEGGYLAGIALATGGSSRHVEGPMDLACAMAAALVDQGKP